MSIYKNLKNLYRSQKNSYAVYLSVVFCVVIYLMDVLTIKKGYWFSCLQPGYH